MFFKNKWKQWGISVMGQSHSDNKIPNQDSFVFDFKGNANKKVLYAAVADGLGSKCRSELGAKALCKTVKKVSKFFKSYPETTPSDIALYVQGLWTSELMRLKPVKISDFSTTAVFALLYKNKLIVCQMGDGLVCGLFDDESKDFILSDNDNDGFANITVSLGTGMKLENWKVGLTTPEGLQCLFLCTDGIATDIEEKEFCFIKSLMDEYKNKSVYDCLHDAKHWISQWPVKGNLDDKTIVMITKEVNK